MTISSRLISIEKIATGSPWIATCCAIVERQSCLPHPGSGRDDDEVGECRPASFRSRSRRPGGKPDDLLAQPVQLLGPFDRRA